jgi:hypothetical protein
MGVFATEAEMQEWLSDALARVEGLCELIDGLAALDTAVGTNLGQVQVLSAFRKCLKSLYITQTIFENENISVSDPDVLKPDFVLYAPETESIVIVELKNLVSPSRQAGTELGAYTAEIRACIPFLSDGEVVHVLISQEWPALLKHYARHEIVWQGRKLLCLRPVRRQNNTLALEILPLSEIGEDLSGFQVGEGHLGSYNICLYDHCLYQQGADRERLAVALDVFKVALQAMAVTGNRLNSHGFAFLWKDRWKESLAPYSIVVANFAPFKSLERFVKDDAVSAVIERFIRVVTDFGPEGHGITLTEVTDTCVEIVRDFCSPTVEGFTTWEVLRDSMASRMDHLAFVGWGFFGEAAVEEVKARHRCGDLTCSLTSPVVGLAVLEKLIDPEYEVLDLSYYFYSPDDAS